MSIISEADWEQDALDELAEPLLWRPARGPEIAPGSGERDTWDELLIRPRLLEAMQRLNPDVPVHYLKQALDEIVTPKSQDAITENQRIHSYLVAGYPLHYIDSDGTEATPTIHVLSPDPDQNDWLAVNQVTIVHRDHRRRFDLVLYVNGMPLSIVELKRAGSESATVASAYSQLQTYLHEFPMAFRFCAFTLASDGLNAEYGTPFTPLNHFAPWNVDDDGEPIELSSGIDGDGATPLQHALDGLYNQERFLHLLRSFTAFDESGEGLTKRIAKPHQYFAVSKAVGATVAAVETTGKAGVVWHTQGSGKSMEMELYANLVSRHPTLRNPTIVVITDRKELDGQLYETFDHSLLLPETPKQIKRRSDLRDELSNRTTGGIYFTTLQKFGLSKAEKDAGSDHPLLTDRRNVIVIVDEAHRSHYDDIDGYARHLRDGLPNATLIAFTGTPVSLTERNTREVFGDYIDVYDLTRAVGDGATVPVYFEPRLVKVGLASELSEDEIDAIADEVTTGLDDTERARMEASVAVVNAVYGAPERLEALAADIVEHWEQRSERMRPYIEAPGKALIVGATREICARLYERIVALRPGWHSDDLARGKIKVVYSGTPSDAPPIRDHVRRESQNKTIKRRLKDVDDELELVIVKDMMLTGFDAPPLHTLYLDRPLKGALLMQTLARVNRTFRGKQDGLLVAYAPLVDNLTKALAEYTRQDQESKPIGRNIDEAVGTAREMVARLQSMLEGCDWKAVAHSGEPRAWFHAANKAANYLRNTRDPRNDPALGADALAARFRRLSGQLSRAWALASGQETLGDLREDIAFFEEVRVWMAKWDAAARKANGEPVPEEIQRMLGRLIDDATDAGDVLDIYDAAGLPRPSLAGITPEFTEKAKKARNPQLAIEALRSLLMDESAAATRNNLVRQRAFSERISELMNKYTNQQLTAAEVIAAMVEVVDEVHAEGNRGAHFDPPLSDDELAFYDAIAENRSALELQGESVLAQIARDLVEVMRRDVRTDWTVRDDVKAKLRSSIKRLLVKYRYPPDKQPGAIRLVIDQMEQMAPRYARERASR